MDSFRTPRTVLYIDKYTYLPWPSTLRTRDLPHGPRPFINHLVRRPSTDFIQTSNLSDAAPRKVTAKKIPEAQPPKPSKVRIHPELLPRPSTDSKPIIVTSQDTGKIAAALLKRKGVRRTTQFHSKQAQILADLLGGTEATWKLAFVMLPSGSGENPNERADSFEGIQVHARVLYIDFVKSQQVCFKLTTETIEALKKRHRDLCYGSFETHSRGDVMIMADVKSLMDNFERAIEHFLRHADTACLDEMERTVPVSSQLSSLLKSSRPSRTSLDHMNATSALSQSC